MRRVVVVLGLLAVLALAWRALAPSAGDASLARLRRAGVVRIGYAIEPPYAFLTEDGTPTGEGPTLAAAVARRLGIARVEWHLADFSLLIDGLRSHRFDVVAAGMFVTAERARKIAFSRPTFAVREGLLVRRGGPRPASVDALLAEPGLRVAVLSGSVEERALVERGLPPERLICAPDAHTAQVAVTTGAADALLLSRPTLRWMAERSAGALVMVDEFEDGGPPSAGAFGFRPEDRSLRAAWDDELAALLGSAEHALLVAPFGFTRDELPGQPP